MEKRVVIAAALSIGILVLWGLLFPAPKQPPPPAPLPVVTEPSPDTAPGGGQAQAPSVDQPAPTGAPAVTAEAVIEHVVETRLFRVELSNEGARAISWRLREYTTKGGESLELVPQFDGAPPRMLALDLEDPALSERLNTALYAVESSKPAPHVEQVRFTWSDGQGLEARKTLTFEDASYLVGVEVAVVDRGRVLPARVVLGPDFGAHEDAQDASTYYYSGQAAWSQGGSVTRLKSAKLDEPGGFEAGLQWVGLEDQYFAALIVPDGRPTQVAWRSIEIPAKDTAADDDPRTEPLLAAALGGEQGLVFVGPKKFTLLRELGHGLEDAVWFASNPFLAWFARFIFLCLLWIHDHTIPNYGLAIVLSTFALRVVLFPVNQYSMVSMKKTQLQMQRLQPKVKRIREKYKKAKDADTRTKMNQEMMEMYRQEGVNPMGGLSGCLPLLAQFPILIGFYNMLTVAVELRGAPFFGWIHDLSRADPFYVTPILMGVTMFLQQRMAMSKVKDPVQLQQQRIMMIMPVVFTWICIQMPAGMVLYWFVNNVLGMGQQWLVNRHTSRLEAAEQGA